MAEVDFWKTDAGQFIAGAHRYISAARVLRFSKEAETEGHMLKTPVLHLLAHGMELLFKYPLLRSGASQAQVTKEFGHNLKKLWLDQGNRNLRRNAIEAAREAWRRAESNGQWPEDNFSLDPEEVLVKAIGDLGHLHGRGSSFALRYTISQPMLAPRPAFLIEAFGEIAERTAMYPSYLDH